MAFLSRCPLAIAVGAAGREQMCWTYIERCALLLAPGCPRCRRDEHTGRLAHGWGGSDSRGPQGNLWDMKQSHHLPTASSWPLLTAGVGAAVTPGWWKGSRDGSSSPGQTWVTPSCGAGTGPGTGTPVAGPRCWLRHPHTAEAFSLLARSPPALEGLTRPQAGAWIN